MTVSWLSREDIVGKRIAGVFRVNWRHFEETDVTVAKVIVQLEDDTLFSLGGIPFEERPIEQVELLPSELGERVAWVENAQIEEVVESAYWPNFGLLLANQKFLYVADTGPHRVDVILERVGERYTLDDVVTYWGHQPLGAVD